MAFRKMLSCLAAIGCLLWSAPGICAAPGARLIVLDAAALENCRAQLRQGDHALYPAFAKLVRNCEEGMTLGPWSVTWKTETSPTGDRHEYVSYGPYFWPNPATKDGLPYVIRDGEVNPKSKTSDSDALVAMSRTARILALGWFYTGNPNYASRAALILRTWFLDPATAMRPDMQYAQGAPGGWPGRAWGIVESRQLLQVVDAAALLEGSRAWSREDAAKLKRWFGQFVTWLETSEFGKAEARAPNNHQSWYLAQVAGFAAYAGMEATARQAVVTGRELLASQIAPDGCQPEEVRRPTSLRYSLFNLEALYTVACIGENLGIDLWNVPSPGDARCKIALDYMLPALLGRGEWPHKNTRPLGGWEAVFVLRQGCLHYHIQAYDEALRVQLGDAYDANRIFLEFPGEAPSGSRRQGRAHSGAAAASARPSCGVLEK
jgi:hypothetical protein